MKAVTRSDLSRCYPQHQKGFVLTLELILITTILLLGSITSEMLVSDGNNRVLGKVLGFDEHEAPLIPYVDRSLPPLAPDPAHRNYRALIGIRDDRFTSREPLYYEGPNCAGDPCIKVASDEVSDSRGTDGIRATGAVSYIYALQGGPTYGIGRSADGIRGDLFRSTPAACPIAPASIQSRYLSQKVVSGSPCEAFSISAEDADTSCLVSVNPGSIPAPLQPEETAVSCASCPSGFESQGDVLDRYQKDVKKSAKDALSILGLNKVNITLGDICCPEGSQLSEESDLASALTYAAIDEALTQIGVDLSSNSAAIETLAVIGITPGPIQCSASISLRAAEPVLDPNDPARNTLDQFVAPFKLNLPPTQSNADDQWVYIPPDGEGN